MSEPSGGEAALRLRMRTNDPSVVEDLVRAHSTGVYRVVAGIVGTTEAEDLTQEVFVRVSQSLGSFRGESSLKTWVYRIATNTALKRLRKRRRRAVIRLGEREVISPSPAPDDALRREEQKAALHRALEQLPEHQRAVVVLRGLEGLSYEEVARVLQIRRPTAESRMARAKVKLKELLGPWLEDGGT